MPGGLPLEMCQGIGEEAGPSSGNFDSEEKKRYRHQDFSTKDDSLHINRQIRENLLEQLNEIEHSGRFDRAALPLHQRPCECTLKFEPKNPEELFDGHKSLSLTSRFSHNYYKTNISFYI